MKNQSKPTEYKGYVLIPSSKNGTRQEIVVTKKIGLGNIILGRVYFFRYDENSYQAALKKAKEKVDFLLSSYANIVVE